MCTCRHALAHIARNRSASLIRVCKQLCAVCTASIQLLTERAKVIADPSLATLSSV